MQEAASAAREGDAPAGEQAAEQALESLRAAAQSLAGARAGAQSPAGSDSSSEVRQPAATSAARHMSPLTPEKQSMYAIRSGFIVLLDG